MIARLSLCLCLAGLVNTVAVARTQQLPSAFDVVSVKKNVSNGPGGTRIDLTGRTGSFIASNATLRMVILAAYSLRPDQLVGGPGWLDSDKFDIQAKSAGQMETREHISVMVQALLADRFGLVLTKESRQRDVYILKLARSDGRLGPDLRKAAEDCASKRPSDPFAIAAGALKPSSGLRPSFGGSCSQISSISAPLERRLNAPVIDETGLAGMWDYAVVHSSVTSSAADDPAGSAPSLFQALDEQLGLKLERQIRAVEVLLVTSVHQPSEN